MESKQQKENIVHLIFNHDKIDTLKSFFFILPKKLNLKKKKDFYYFIFSFYKYIYIYVETSDFILDLFYYSVSTLYLKR